MNPDKDGSAQRNETSIVVSDNWLRSPPPKDSLMVEVAEGLKRSRELTKVFEAMSWRRAPTRIDHALGDRNWAWSAITLRMSGQ
jgi:hypothetical protein